MNLYLNLINLQNSELAIRLKVQNYIPSLPWMKLPKKQKSVSAVEEEEALLCMFMTRHIKVQYCRGSFVLCSVAEDYDREHFNFKLTNLVVRFAMPRSCH